jgi:transposase-like protein
LSGKGQPPKIGPDRYGELLGLLRSGLSVSAAARKMEVYRSTLYNLAERVPEMGAAMERARAAYQEEKQRALETGLEHEPSESCYVNNHCRTPRCTAAATEARDRRRTAVPAPVTPLQRIPHDLVVGEQRVNVYALLDDIDGLPLADTA